jgi:hypothetical protein
MPLLFIGPTEEDGRESLVRDVLTPQILSPITPAAQVTQVDFTIDDVAKRVEVEIELYPFGAKPVTWTFLYEHRSGDR